MNLRGRIAAARTTGAPAEAERARAGLAAFVDAMDGQGEQPSRTAELVAKGAAAQGIGRMALQAMSPRGLACAEGCAFCCILQGADGGTITEAEAQDLHAALAPLAGQPDATPDTMRYCSCAMAVFTNSSCRPMKNILLV